MATEEEIRIVLRTLAEGQGAQQTRTALNGVRTAAGEAQRSVAGVSGGFRVGAGDALRFGAALGGVGLGLSLAASAGTAIAQVMTAATTANAESQRVARATAAAYGAQADAFTTFASKLSAGTGFTKTAILEASLSARTLSTNYGLSIQQTQRLIQVSADLARIHGIGITDAFSRVQSAIRGEAEASEFLGLTLNATFLQQNAQNGALRQTFTTLTDVQRAQVVYAEVLKQTQVFAGQAEIATGSLDGAMARAELAGQNLALAIGKVIEPANLAGLEAQAKGFGALEAAIKAALDRQLQLNDALKFGIGPRMLENPPVIPALPKPITDRSQISPELAKGLSAVADEAVGAVAPVEELTEKIKLFDERFRPAELTLARFSAELGQLEARSAAGARALERLSQSGSVVAQGAQAAENILRQIDIDQAQRLEDRARGVGRLRELLVIESQISDPRDASAQTQAARERLRILDQLVPLTQALAEAQRQQKDIAAATAVHQGEEARAVLQILSQRQEVARLEREIAQSIDKGLGLRQEEARLLAQQRAGPSTNALEDTQATIRRNELLLGVRGQDPDVRRAARAENRALRRDVLPGQELAAEDANRAVTLAERSERTQSIQDQLRTNRGNQRLEGARSAAQGGENLVFALGQVTERFQILDKVAAALTASAQRRLDIHIDGGIDVTGSAGTGSAEEIADEVAGRVRSQILAELTEANGQAQTPPVIQVSAVRR